MCLRGSRKCTLADFSTRQSVEPRPNTFLSNTKNFDSKFYSRHNNQNNKLVDRKWKAATPGGSP